MPNFPGDSGSAAQKTIATALTTAVNAPSGGWNNSQDVSCTAPNLTISLPTPTVADFGKAITLRNTGSNPFTVALTGGTLNSAVGLIMNPGSIWTFEAQTLTTANVSATNAAQSVLAEDVAPVYLASTFTILVGNTSPATASADILTITVPSAGQWAIKAVVRGLVQISKTISYGLFDSANILIPNTETLVSNPTAISQASGTNIFYLNTTGPTTYKLKAWDASAAGTGQILSNADGKTSLTASKIAGVAASGIAGAVAGDRKFSDLLIDHGNWILLDGRLKTALTTAQQAVATSLGYGANIPDMRGRMALGIGGAIGATALSQGGSSTIAQNQLPNVTLSISGSASQGGNGIWWYNGTTGNARINATEIRRKKIRKA
jgi:hypothetical protein